MPRRITQKVIEELIDQVNEDLESRDFDWRLVLNPSYDYYTIMKQVVGATTWCKYSPDAAATVRENYLWLRGLQSGLWLEADHGSD